MLARLACFDQKLLHPVKHQDIEKRDDLCVIKARDTLVRVKITLISTVRVSAQPAPSGFEADSVVCSATNRNNGRTAWDGKDEIIGRRNCQNIGTAA